MRALVSVISVTETLDTVGPAGMAGVVSVIPFVVEVSAGSVCAKVSIGKNKLRKTRPATYMIFIDLSVAGFSSDTVTLWLFSIKPAPTPVGRWEVSIRPEITSAVLTNDRISNYRLQKNASRMRGKR